MTGKSSRRVTHLNATANSKDTLDVGKDLAPRALAEREPEVGHANEIELLDLELRKIAHTGGLTAASVMMSRVQDA